MRVLLDECVDWRLLRDLADYDAKSLKQRGWEHVKNGALLRLAATEFDGESLHTGSVSFPRKRE